MILQKPFYQLYICFMLNHVKVTQYEYIEILL